MKRFVFTLQSVLKYKLTVEKKQKAELAAVVALLARLYEQEKQLELAFENCAKSLEQALRNHIDVPQELSRHDAYFLLLREQKDALMKKIEAAEKEKIRCQQALLATMNEIKTLEKIKDEQYAAYLEEVRAEEAKDIGDLVSYKSVTQAKQ